MTTQGLRDVRVAVYGDVNLNIIDGSAIWLQSIASVLSKIPRCDVTVVLKAREKRDILVRPIRELDGVTVVNPIEDGMVDGEQMSRHRAMSELARLDEADPFDIILLRGFDLCQTAVQADAGRFAGRLWSYCTDVPQHADEISDEVYDKISEIAEASRYVLCQTEAFRSYLESHIPTAAKRAILLPPMIPDGEFAPHEKLGDTLKLIYIGKYAALWNTLEMTESVALLRDLELPVELHMVGDKIHNERERPEFHDQMAKALRSTDGVIWHGGQSRDDAQAMLKDADVAIGWRAPELDESLELSTKLLEYGAAGLPAIVNRNPMHEQLLGFDYPLFANTKSEFANAVRSALDQQTRQSAAARCQQAARGFTFTRVAEKLAPFIDRAVPHKDLRGRKEPLKVLVACHDFKFFTRIQEHLAGIRGVELRTDAWSSISEHDEAKSRAHLDWADVVVCEWCTDAAIWYSKNKRDNQRLIVRLHRFELYARYVKELEIGNVDSVVFVGDFYRDEAKKRLGWDDRQMTVIPNWVDTEILDRPKVPGAIFNLGMIGIAPRRKRLDRALSIIEKIREHDPRFQLYLKTKMPWAYWWIWRDPEEQEHYKEIFRRINSSSMLQGAVHFDDFGPDVGAWLRKIGFVLSTSDDESFHLSPAEGMASRALPMLLPWGGADAIYESEWILADEQAVADKILKVVESGDWCSSGERVREQISARYTVEKVCQAWQDLVLAPS